MKVKFDDTLIVELGKVKYHTKQKHYIEMQKHQNFSLEEFKRKLTLLPLKNFIRKNPH